MPTEVRATPRAQQQIAALSRRERQQFDAFLDNLASQGCAALAYRLSGPTPIDHICVKHLRAALRVIVAFESVERVWILLVGMHDDSDPVFNVYTELYRMLGGEPPADAGRTKPPCCDEIKGLPPVLAATVDDILANSRQIRQTRRR